MARIARDQLKCGGCGGELHKLYRIEGGERDGDILVVCVDPKCRSQSRLTVTAPTVEIEHDGGDGTLTGGWR